MLQGHGIKHLVDVRSVPRSRHNPQFAIDTLPQSLRQANIAYTHRPDLGGLRHARKDSANTGWQNGSFRGYADYMQTPQFASGIDALIEMATLEPIAVMCAEAVPWRCHRSLIADALLARNLTVEEISSATQTQPHKLTSFARVEGTEVTYPGAQTVLPLQPDSTAAN